jgi:hypothetical protein
MATYTKWDELKGIENRPIWACAYELCENKISMKLIQKPIRGIISGRTFAPLKKDSDTEVVKSRGVRSWSRCYADTYDECVELYNSLVQERIEFFEDRLRETKDDFIKMESK